MNNVAPIEHILAFVDALTCLALLAVVAVLYLEAVEFVRNDPPGRLSIRPPLAGSEKRQIDQAEEDLAA